MPIMWKLSGHWISPRAAWISTPCSATLWRRSTNYQKLVLGSVPISPAVLNPFWPNWKSPFAAVSTRPRPTAWCPVAAPKTVKHPRARQRGQEEERQTGCAEDRRPGAKRSEEHTSELQSLRHL